MRDAILRVDKHLRMDVCEKIEKGGLKCVDVGLEMEDSDVAISGGRMGMGVSMAWHLESPRYKLEVRFYGS